MKPALSRFRNSLGAVLTAGSLFATSSIGKGAAIVIDDFEVDEGHFSGANPATASGTNRHLTSVTADLSTAFAFTGAGSQLLVITPQNPGAGIDFPSDQFRLRFLSAGGTIASNVNVGPDGYVGYFLRTTAPGLVTAPGIDDGIEGTALERGVFQPVIADGQWHLYQFNLDDPAQWDAFALATANGSIEGPNVSFDSIFIQGPSIAPVEVYLDTVAYNTSGDLSALPEPGSATLLSLGTLALLIRRSRRVQRSAW